MFLDKFFFLTSNEPWSELKFGILPSQPILDESAGNEKFQTDSSRKLHSTKMSHLSFFHFALPIFLTVIQEQLIYRLTAKPTCMNS